MRWKACVVPLLWFFARFPGAHAAPGETGDATLRFGPPGAWVDALEAPVLSPSPDDEKRGYACALEDRQIHRGTGERLVRSVFAFTSSGGVQEHSAVQVDWNPAYESATVHWIRRTRDGKTEDLARPGVFQTLRREPAASAGRLAFGRGQPGRRARGRRA